MTTTLHLSLAEIAALARVRRPVVSMWRKRFAAGPLAFPPPRESVTGVERFDAAEVARWLQETRHGNNPDAVADAAAFATVATQSLADDHDTLTALLALRAADGLPLVGAGGLAERALRADPSDAMLLREVRDLPEDSPWPAYVDALVDAAYSPEGAWQRLVERTTSPGSAGAAGPFSEAGRRALAELAASLTDPARPVLADSSAPLTSAELFTATVAQLAGNADTELHVAEGEEGRGIRRLLLVQGLTPSLSSDAAEPSSSAVHLARVRGIDPATELAACEEIVVDLSDTQRALIIGPDALLTEPLTGAAASSREHMLRSGRVRGIVRLPVGLIPTAPRQSLAVWLIGGPQGGAPLAERFTVIGDLRGHSLTRAREQDLVSDLLASLGTAREARAHAFRFVRFVRTSTLIATDESLVATSPVSPAPAVPTAELPALIDGALGRLDPPVDIGMVPAAGDGVSPIVLADAIATGDARVRSGARLRTEDTRSEDGFPVLGRDEVREGAASDRRIDRLRLAAEYPRAELTRPGDVVFLAGSHPAALVDTEGSSVVEYPARILRLSGGALVPEVVATDINALPDPLPWRRWVLRRVPVAQGEALRRSLGSIRAARVEAERRARELTSLEALVMSAVSAGVLAASAPAPHEPLTEGTR